MRLGTEDKKKLRIAAVAGVFGIIALGVIYNELFGFSSSTPAPPPPPAAVAAPAPAQPARSTTPASASSTGTPTGVVTAPPGAIVVPKTAQTEPANAQKLGTTSAQLDPTLHMEAMLATEQVVYTGTGRNIFAAGPAPQPIATVVIPKPIVGPRPSSALPPQAQGPTGAPPTPPPPPIDLKFFGTATAANGTRHAFLIKGEDIFYAGAGDIVQRRYRVISIAANSITIEDIPNNNKQTLPLLGN